MDQGRNEEEVTVLSEGGFFELVLMSSKPDCIAFKKWVTSEVLPKIRETSCYVADEKANNNPIFRLISSKANRYPSKN